MEKLHGLDLFSGIGGNTLALRDYIKTIAYCEFERHAQGVLLSRMRAGDIEPAPIWDDIRTLTKDQLACPIDIVLGGFPCQDISVAGKGAGITPDTRSGLFYEIIRLIRDLRPSFVFLENVPAIRTRGLNVVLHELTEAGYDCRWTMLSASSVGAPHKRERWFLLAHDRNKSNRHTNNSRCDRNGGSQQEISNQNTNNNRVCEESKIYCSNSQWAVEPAVGRVANGISCRVERIKRLGNAVVPLQAKMAFEILMGLK